MMSRFCLILLALVSGVGAPFASAQSLDWPIEVTDVRIGLPPGRFGTEKDNSTQRLQHIVKRGVWVPVYLDMTVKKEMSAGVKITIETQDSDGLRTSVTMPLITSLTGTLPGAKLKTADFAFTPYVRVGDRSAIVSVSLSTNDADNKTLASDNITRYLSFRDAAAYTVVSLGSKLPGFELPGEKGNSKLSAPRGGRIESSAMTNVEEMPDQWIGYQCADLVVLTTGTASPQFLQSLFADNISESNRLRREALLEWVRRGGKLIVSVGSNAGMLSQLRQFQAILPAPLLTDPASRNVTELPLYAVMPGFTINKSLVSKIPGAQFPVANVGQNPRRAVRSLMPAPGDRTEAGTLPAVLQIPYGLGRISMTTFDLDQSPFVDSYDQRSEMWDYLIRECGSAKAALLPTGASNNFSSSNDNEDEWLTHFRRHVDTFDGVPVVSFGWVAIFILLYTLIIGPIEYIVLKYVFKRLELTWITFPLIVVSVSTAAYFTAYAIKGNDLKMNKVDLVEVDLHGSRVYGKSWFTIFSPRIDSYTVGVEPREGWTVSQPPEPAPLVGWMGGTQGGSNSIVSRGYKHHVDSNTKAVSTALEKVPIQVWSTKTFQASWSGAMNPGVPLIAADLYHPPADPKALTGSFVSNLPVGTITDPYLIYAGRVYKLPAIQPGQKIDVPASGLPEDTNWFTSANVTIAGNQYQNVPTWMKQQQQQNQGYVSSLPIWSLMFHEKVRGTNTLQNASLRDLDQSWRLEEVGKGKYFDEAILVAYINPPAGPTEPMLSNPDSPSATKLWLKGGIPGETGTRESIPGFIRQETFLRVYIPIRPAAAKK
ncbi:MAG: hypothetical protein ACRC8S_17360 [Fimbriiglobus sp.]